jgi:hypothetical protein
MIEELYKKLPLHLAKITTNFTQKYIDKDFVPPTIIGSDGAANL